MFRTLRPRADTPPSANSNAWTMSTTVTHSAPTQGPTSAAASTPPSRWPLVPLATGKLSICTAKMKAAAMPARGTSRSSRSRLALRRLTATQPTATAPAAADVPALMNPSGMCTPTSWGPSVTAGRYGCEQLADANGSQSSQGGAAGEGRRRPRAPQRSQRFDVDSPQRFAAAIRPRIDSADSPCGFAVPIRRADLGPTHRAGSCVARGDQAVDAAAQQGEVPGVEREVVLFPHPHPQLVEQAAGDHDVPAAALADEVA